MSPRHQNDDITVYFRSLSLFFSSLCCSSLNKKKLVVWLKCGLGMTLEGYIPPYVVSASFHQRLEARTKEGQKTGGPFRSLWLFWVGQF